MTATNHVMTGAVIALAVKQPVLAISLAFASHFLLDMIPHFGIDHGDVITRNSKRLYRTVVSTDVVLMLILLIIVPDLAGNKLAQGIVLASMLAAVLPDVVWVYRSIYRMKTKQFKPRGWYARIHKEIQRFEKPVGLVVEVVWLGVMFMLFSKLMA